MLQRRAFDDRLNLSSNELIHPTVDRILREALDRICPSVLRTYPVTANIVADIAWCFGLDAREVILTPGSDAAIRLISHHYAARADGSRNLVLQYPNYYAWEQAALWLGLPVARVTSECADPLDQGERLLAVARSQHGSLIAVSVPNGPVGWCIPTPHLEMLIEVAGERGHLLVIDSCYQAFNGNLAEQIERRGDNVLVIQSLSKSHGLAGVRIGLVCGTAAQMDALSESRIEHAVSGASLFLARAVLEHEAALKNIWDEIAHARRQAALVLRASGAPPLPSAGNFLTVRLGSTGMALGVTQWLLAAGYRVRNLSEMPGLQGCIRFTIGDLGTTRKVLDAIQCALSCSMKDATHGP